jgi:hypothetical protein
LAKNYPNQPIIQALFAFVVGAASSATDSPLIGGVVNTAIPLIVYGVEEILAKRHKILFDELEKGKHDLTDEVIKKEEFLHNFFRVYNAAIRTAQKDKIKMFARLLLTGIREDALGSAELEEFVQILETLSERELQVLRLLKKFEDSYPQQRVNMDVENSPLETPSQRAKRFWNTFVSEVDRECGVSQEKLPAILNRLARTGLYELTAGLFFDSGGGQGYLTPLFSEFTRWIELEANED